MTTVLPEPVAILNAMRGSPPLCCWFSCADDVERLGVADLLGGLGQVDRGLGRLDLAEEEAALAFLGAPVVEQVARRRRDVRVLLRPPACDRLADLVDDLVRLLLDGPEGVEGELGLRRLLGARDRNEELARSAARLDLAGHLAVNGHEVPDRLDKRRVDDGVLD